MNHPWESDHAKRRFSVFRSSLRARVAFGVALPVFISLIGLSFLHYRQDLSVSRNAAQSHAAQLGDILTHSISHTMLIKDSNRLISALKDIDQLEIVQQVQIVGVSGKLLAASGAAADVEIIDQLDAGCWECHQFSPGKRPRSIELHEAEGIIRISTNISNQPECRSCHQETDANLGVLLIDVSLKKNIAQTNETLYRNLTISGVSTVLITAGVYWLIHNLVVRRVEAFREPIAAYASGDHSTRIELCEHINDEICQLGATFNQMADDIERYNREQDERSNVRQNAILEERERIARELHDGLAQVLGYVSTKVMAVRVNLQRGHINEADRQLTQLEQAAREVSLDVREGILGLKMSSQVDTNLIEALREYIGHFNNLSDVDVELRHLKNFTVELMPDVVFHLMRIMQEALTNSRKHAHPSQVYVSIEHENGFLLMEIVDDGYGFRVQKALDENLGNFGLATMFERAHKIGASLDVQSDVGLGTRVIVKMALGGGRS